MSPVGHSIVGVTFAAVTSQPAATNGTHRLTIYATFIALASLPDWPLPGWGHDRYDISHSIFVNAALIVCVIAIWKWNPRLQEKVPARCLTLGICAWLSHLLLDSFYNHGRGVAIYWPISEGRLNLAMPWFNTLDLSQPITSRHNLMVYAIEFVAYTPLLLLTTMVTRAARTRNKKGSAPGDAEPPTGPER